MSEHGLQNMLARCARPEPSVPAKYLHDAIGLPTSALSRRARGDSLLGAFDRATQIASVAYAGPPRFREKLEEC
jgi:hypothetical protein